MLLTVNYRMLGGFVSLGSTFLARARWALVVAGCMALVGLVHKLPFSALAIVFAGTLLTAYLGRLIPHGKYIGAPDIKACACMGLIGVARLILLLAPLAYYLPFVLYLVPFGFLNGAAYYLGWKYLHEVDSGFYYKDQVFAKGGGEWGEVLTGLLAYELPFWVLLVM